MNLNTLEASRPEIMAFPPFKKNSCSLPLVRTPSHTISKAQAEGKPLPPSSL